MNRRWVRVYADILDDPKIAQISAKSFKFFIFLLVFCAENGIDDKILDDQASICWRFRISEKVYNEAIAELQDKDIISFKNNQLIINNWSKRQYKSDCSTERVKRYRNVTKTLHETPPETETETETDTDTETEGEAEKETECADAPSSHQPKSVDALGNTINYYYKKVPIWYNNILKGLCVEVIDLPEHRKKTIKARLSIFKTRDDWVMYFTWISYSKFLTGQIDPSPDHPKPFQANFDWILKPSHISKILEGSYHDNLMIGDVCVNNFYEFKDALEALDKVEENNDM
jgi:hypothetical protein